MNNSRMIGSKVIFIIMLFSYAVQGQHDEQRAAATIQVKEMINFYNDKNISEYVDYLLPAYFGNNKKAKDDLIEMWNQILKNDTDKFELKKLSYLTKSNNKFQSLFEISFRDKRKSFIAGVSDNQGKEWKFSQSMNNNIQFDQILEYIPDYDISFSIYIDPDFGKRINYNIGDIISPFNYSDIYGNEISSESTKGDIIVLNFWGTWCAPCIKEIPELNLLVDKFKNENVNFIAPAVSTSKENLMKIFLPKHPFSYNIVLINGDEYQITSFPTHIVINLNKEVINIIRGYSKENIKKLEYSIEKAL
ncbi:TlpA family protein disulfide reductase [Christiangramia sp. ASW11-125]|uniref:TlpA family protein disulfide reductase n=1 Tax=Christiangramia sp. ASW11-125 TaxID=3400701 RepID=UPI003AAB3FBF